MTPITSPAPSLVAHLVSALILRYQAVSAHLPHFCRFYPSCSEYARLAILKHGLGHGGWLGLVRVLRCNPFSASGYDPVP